MTFSWFGVDFRPPDPPKNGKKKHVGIDLEPQIPKIKKMTPLPSFLLVFWFQEVPKSMKNQEKSVPRCIQKSMDFFHRFWSDFWWIFVPSGTPKSFKIATKTTCKIQAKKTSKNYAKDRDLGLQNGLLFRRFWLLKSTLFGAVGPPGRPNWKSPPKLVKNHPKYEKMIQNEFKK